MYAGLVSWQACLDGPKGKGATTKRLYEHLCALPDDESLEREARELLRKPLRASSIAFGGDQEERGIV